MTTVLNHTNQKINVGVVGCGMIGEVHIINMMKIKYINNIYIFDESKTKTQELKEKYNNLILCNSYNSMLSNKDIAAVIICVPPSVHFELILMAVKFKKHILIEKPVVISKSHLDKINKLSCMNKELIIMDCASRHSRLQPKFAFIKDFISKGIIGEIYHINHTAIQRNSRPGIEYHPQAKWFYQKRISGGGPLIDWGVYDLSFHLGILDPAPVFINLATQSYSGLDNLSKNNNDFDVEEHSVTFMQFTNMTYYWERSTHAYNEPINETKIYGTKGGIKFNYLSWEDSTLEIFSPHDKDNNSTKIINMQNHTLPENDFYAMDQHFIDCIIMKSTAIQNINESIYHLNIILKCLKDNPYKF